MDEPRTRPQARDRALGRLGRLTRAAAAGAVLLAGAFAGLAAASNPGRKPAARVRPPAPAHPRVASERIPTPVPQPAPSSAVAPAPAPAPPAQAPAPASAPPVAASGGS